MLLVMSLDPKFGRALQVLYSTLLTFFIVSAVAIHSIVNFLLTHPHSVMPSALRLVIMMVSVSGVIIMIIVYLFYFLPNNAK